LSDEQLDRGSVKGTKDEDVESFFAATFGNIDAISSSLFIFTNLQYKNSTA
jgi:hypothetical protein